jgi:hypothetical protein
MKNLIGLGLMLWVSFGVVSAQGSNMSQLCTTIEAKVINNQIPLKVIKGKYPSACIFEASFADDSSINLRIERYRKADDASFELETLRQRWSSKGISEYPSKTIYKRNIDPDGFWDEAAYVSDPNSGSSKLLRRGKFFILIAGDDAFVRQTECLLRNIHFYQ